jgi:hypothetical protein
MNLWLVSHWTSFYRAEHRRSALPVCDGLSQHVVTRTSQGHLIRHFRG